MNITVITLHKGINCFSDKRLAVMNKVMNIRIS